MLTFLIHYSFICRGNFPISPFGLMFPHSILAIFQNQVNKIKKNKDLNSVVKKVKFSF